MCSSELRVMPIVIFTPCCCYLCSLIFPVFCLFPRPLWLDCYYFSNLLPCFFHVEFAFVQRRFWPSFSFPVARLMGRKVIYSGGPSRSTWAARLEICRCATRRRPCHVERHIRLAGCSWISTFDVYRLFFFNSGWLWMYFVSSVMTHLILNALYNHCEEWIFANRRSVDACLT